MPPPRTLVLGATGQLGAELCRQLGDAALPAARNPPDAAWLSMDLQTLATDANALPRLLDNWEITAVICSAGATDVERCETDPAWAEAANHTGPLALARAARHVPFVFYSTDYVFDGCDGPYTEDAPTAPLSVYGRSKLAGERAILNAHPGALVIRTTTVYGPDPQGKNFLYTLRRLLTTGKTMRVPSDQFANPTFNVDLATATLRLLADKHTGLFHVAGPEFLARTEFALLACRLLGLEASRVEPVCTADLRQRAARPLLGGLRSDKFAGFADAPGMRAPAQGILDWQAALQASQGQPA